MIGNMLIKPLRPLPVLQRPGFSLIEIVVAAGLFAVVIMVAVNLFIIFLRRPLQQIDEFHVYEEINNALWQLNQTTQSDMVDYTTYGTISNPETDLYLISPDGTASTHIYLSSGQLLADVVTAGTPSTLTLTSSASSEVYIDTFNVYVYPSLNPFDLANATNSQPAVELQIVAHSIKNPDITFAAQTLITTRVYER